MTSCLRPDRTTTSLEQNFNTTALDELECLCDWVKKARWVKCFERFSNVKIFPFTYTGVVKVIMTDGTMICDTSTLTLRVCVCVSDSHPSETNHSSLWQQPRKHTSLTSQEKNSWTNSWLAVHLLTNHLWTRSAYNYKLICEVSAIRLSLADSGFQFLAILKKILYKDYSHFCSFPLFLFHVLFHVAVLSAS